MSGPAEIIYEALCNADAKAPARNTGLLIDSLTAKGWLFIHKSTLDEAGAVYSVGSRNTVVGAEGGGHGGEDAR